MFRKFAGVAVLGLMICATAALAGEIKGKVTKVDESNNKITLNVDNKDTEYTVAKDCKWPKVKNKKDGSDKEMDIKGLAKIVEKMKEKDKGGFEISATVEKKDGKDVITEIKTEMGKKKKDKDDKKDGK